MEESGGTGLASAVLDLIAVRPPEPAGVLTGLVEAVHDLFGVAAGASLISADAAPGVVTAGPEHLGAVLVAGFDRGPGADCARTGRPVPCDDLAQQRPRWLSFVARATASNVTAAWALPIRRDADVFGALLVLGGPDGSPGLADLGLLADAAAVALSDAEGRESAELEIRQLRMGLRSRITVEQAKGIIAAHAGLDVEAAFELLRTHSRRNRRSLTDTAAAVVSREIPPSTIVDRHG